MIRLLSLLLALLLLAGCSARGETATPAATEPVSAAEPPAIPPTEETAPPTEATAPPTEPLPVEAPPLDLREPGQITVYDYDRVSGIFTPFVLPLQDQPPTLVDAVAAVETRLEVTIPVLSVTQQKGMVVIDLAESFLDDYTKAEITRILTALGATLRENHRSFEWIQYPLAGEVGIFGERFELPPLKLVELDPAIFAAIRAGIPYEGLAYEGKGIFFDDNYAGITAMDDAARKLAAYLSVTELAGLTFTSVSELPNEHIIETAVKTTQQFSTCVDDEFYTPALLPFVAPASELLGMQEDWFWLKEHVEETIRLLYGDLSYTHQSFMGEKYRYLEPLGVYTPPHMGGSVTTIPAVFAYEDTGDQIVAEVAYLDRTMSGYAYRHPGGEWEEIPEGEQESFARNKAARCTVTVDKQPDGSFIIASQTLQ